MLFRYLCRPSRILFKPPHAISIRKITDLPIRKVAVDEKSARSPNVDNDSEEPIAKESDSGIEERKDENHVQRYRYFSAPILKDTFYFIEQRRYLVIQGIVLNQMFSSGKEIHGACRLDKRGEDATSHLAEAYGLNFENLDDMASMYMRRTDREAGSYFITMDEIEWYRSEKMKEQNKVGYMRSKLQTVAWKVEYDLEGDAEVRFCKETQTRMGDWLLGAKLKNMYDGTIWTKKSVRNVEKWKRVRDRLARVMLSLPRKSKR